MILTSCATAITVGKDVDKYKINELLDSADMDFIGFKIDSMILSTSSNSRISSDGWGNKVDIIMSEFDQAKAVTTITGLRQLGSELENSNIANNKSDAYFGIYSLQELELYKTNSRYVTFVEVAKNKLNYNSNEKTSTVLASVGAGFLGGGLPILGLGLRYENNDDKNLASLGKTYKGLGIGFSIVGGIFCLSALYPSKTSIDFSGIYNVYLYDAKEKALIRKDAVTVNLSECFSGSYSYDESSKDIVHEYISKNIANELLKKYEELNKWIRTRN